MNKDKELGAWAQAWRAENLTEEMRTLINQANFDLWYGPCAEDGYPGFETACKWIRDALANVPSQLYLDPDCDDWTETEPFELGMINEEWVLLNRPALINALVGRELGEYVR